MKFLLSNDQNAEVKDMIKEVTVLVTKEEGPSAKKSKNVWDYAFAKDNKDKMCRPCKLDFNRKKSVTFVTSLVRLFIVSTNLAQ